MKIQLKYKSKKIKLEAKKCNWWLKFSGLMFRRRETGALIFEFKKSTWMAIHSVFVFFPFLAVYTDDKMNVLEIRKVKSFKFNVKPREKYNFLIEIPFNNKYRRIITFLVGARKI